MNENIPFGLIPVDESDHIVTGSYKSHASEDDPNAIEVIEIPNARLLHTRIEGGHPDGRRAVFSRIISHSELDIRTSYHDSYPEEYQKSIIEGLAK